MESLAVVSNPFAPTYVPCNFTVNTLLQDSFRICSKYVDVLETCPMPGSESQAVKLEVAYDMSMCLSAVWAYDPEPQYLANYTSATPPTLKADPSCKYPDFAPIVQEACAWDIQQASNITCQQKGNFTVIWSPDMLGWTRCFDQASAQYWRCTQQKPYDQVAQCVIDNAQKVDWLPPIYIYNGALTCKTATYWIGSQAASVTAALIMAIGITLAGPWISRAMKKIGLFSKSSKNSEKVEEPPQNPWEPQTKFVLKCYQVMASLGGELLTAALVVVVMRNTGVGAFRSPKNLTLGLFLFNAIRPRVAPFTGLLAFFKGWSVTGLADLITDIAMSLISGFGLTIYYIHCSWTTNPNPSAPNNELRVLGIGAALAFLPAFLSIFGASVLGHALWMNRGGRDAITLFASVFLGVLVGFGLIFGLVVFIPLMAVYEIFTGLILAATGTKKMHPGRSWGKRIHEKLSLNGSWFRPVLVWIVSMSWLINVGSWLFFASYLIVEGEAYCPVGDTAITVIWILGPQAIKIPFKLFEKYLDRFS